MTNDGMTIFWDSQGQAISPTHLSSHLDQIESLYVSALLGVSEPENDPITFSNYYEKKLVEDRIPFDDFSRSLSIYINSYKNSTPLTYLSRYLSEQTIESASHDLERIGFQQGKVDLRDLRENLSHFNHFFSRGRYLYAHQNSRDWLRRVELDRLLIKEIHYTNPLEFKLSAERTWKALLVALIIAGGEVNLREGSAKLPGLVDVSERMTRLVMEVLDSGSDRKADEIIDDYLRSAASETKGGDPGS